MVEFSASTAEEAIAEWVSSSAGATEIAGLLREQLPLYAGRSSNEVTRIRGFLLAAFERTGLPSEALPYVMEELESGQDAYTVAAAARALRGGAPSPELVPLLRGALERMRGADVSMTFEVYKPRWPFPHPTTASDELRKTLAWIGPAEPGPSCCHAASHTEPIRDETDIRQIELEDQDGDTVRFGDFFVGKPAVVVFFYTRCDNPEKCSLSITKLAGLQVLKGDARVAAISYDPLYDTPARLKVYGRNRAIEFGNDVRFFRAPRDFEQLRSWFDLGVNYIGSMVNRHRIELYVLDTNGKIASSFTRMQWDNRRVIEAVQALARA